MSQGKGLPPPTTTLGLIRTGLPAADHPLNQLVTRVELSLDRLEWLLRRQAAERPREDSDT